MSDRGVNRGNSWFGRRANGVGWNIRSILPFSTDELHIHVSGPPDGVADNEFLHELGIAFADPDLADDRFVVWIPATESTNDEGIEVDVPSLGAEFVGQ